MTPRWLSGGGRRLVAASVGSAPARAVLRLGERTVGGPRGVLTVLTYHRVLDPWSLRGADPSMVSAPPAAFAEQMDHIAERCRPLSIAGLLELRHHAGDLPPRSVLVTFDDAYRDFAATAWPILRDRSIPVALFVPTAFAADPGRAFWWDRLHHAVMTTERSGTLVCDGGTIRLGTPRARAASVARLRDGLLSRRHDEILALVEHLVRRLDVAPLGGSVLSWSELRGLAREGVTVVPHTRTHPRLDGIDHADAVAEIRGSVDDVTRELGWCPPAFAYPGGRSTEAVRNALPSIGVEVAFTTERGHNRLGSSDWLRLRRINVGRRCNLATLRAELLGAVAAGWSRPPAGVPS